MMCEANLQPAIAGCPTEAPEMGLLRCNTRFYLLQCYRDTFQRRS
jgi:hypothetical protein